MGMIIKDPNKKMVELHNLGIREEKWQIAKLEESLKKATQQIHQIQCMRPPQQTTRPAVSATVRNPISTKQNGYSPYSLHPNCPSTSEM
ncbi:unnamed protein product [Caretta caretta]